MYCQRHGAQWTNDIQNGYAVGADGFAPSARSASPGMRGLSNFPNQIQLDVPHDSPDVETVFASDRARRAAAAALLTRSEHTHIAKFFCQLPGCFHIDPTPIPG
jgi:hypothetical protein